MAVTSTRFTSIVHSGDVASVHSFQSASNAISSGVINLLTLSAGPNTIGIPSQANVSPTAVTIVPPAGNVISIVLKGIAGDTGIPIHPSDHTTLTFGPGPAPFVLVAGSQINGVRFFWS